MCLSRSYNAAINLESHSQWSMHVFLTVSYMITQQQGRQYFFMIPRTSGLSSTISHGVWNLLFLTPKSSPPPHSRLKEKERSGKKGLDVDSRHSLCLSQLRHSCRLAFVCSDMERRVALRLRLLFEQVLSPFGKHGLQRMNATLVRGVMEWCGAIVAASIEQFGFPLQQLSHRRGVIKLGSEKRCLSCLICLLKDGRPVFLIHHRHDASLTFMGSLKEGCVRVFSWCVEYFYAVPLD
mmetsp:Transcript_45845/g.113976  ORF Transcript_45845/g.113976 Transcript_45845/m.113976 type:complete len:237 (-) Transcript_45845:730-1440(-)